MKIKIRKVPFSATDWNLLKKTSLDANDRATATNTACLVKNFALEQSDKEVYTAFYAYLNGYALDEEKALRVQAAKSQVDTSLATSDLMDIYGYRPLTVHFIGYGTADDGKADSDTNTALQNVSKEVKEWYENMPYMLSGSITLSLYYQSAGAIMPGEIVTLCGLDFYVEGVTHSWNYGSNAEINLSVSRGGVYKAGKFDKAETAKAQIGNINKLLG